MRVQLLSFIGCPNVGHARETLLRVLAAQGVTAPIEEIDTMAPGTAESLRHWGSPTILVDGADVGGESAPAGATCRVYHDPDGAFRGSPSEDMIAAAVRSRRN